MDFPDLSSFISNPDPLIATTANQLQQINEAYRDHHLTLSEYKELTGDLVDYTKIGQDIQDIHRQEQVKAAFDAFIDTIQLVMQFVPIP